MLVLTAGSAFGFTSLPPTPGKAKESTANSPVSKCLNVFFTSSCSTSTRLCPPPGQASSTTTCSTAGGPKPDPNSYMGSFIDGITFNHHHVAIDYGGDASASGCTSCGSASAANSLSCLTLQRRHRYRDMTQWSSFGPGVFLNYDTKLRIYASGAGAVVELFDPQDTFPRKFVDGVDGDPLDGVYNDVYSGAASGLRLLDDAMQFTTVYASAAWAELPARDGRKFLFEVVNLKRTRPASTAGHTGQALRFDGVNDYVDVGTPAGLNFAGQITISAWIKPTATSGIRNIVCHGPSTEVYLRINAGKYEVGSYNGTDHRAIATIPGGDLNTWVHLAGVYDGTAWKLYRNGVLAATTTDAVGAVVGTGKWGFGAYGAGNSRFFAGDLDEVQIYNRGLTASEVGDVMNTGALTDVLSSWPLEAGKAVDMAADNDGIPGGVGTPVGRLSKISDRNGYSQAIAYKTFTEAELEASPERQWQIATASDANGRTATFTYLPTQVSARWVVSKIVLPNAAEVTYDYTDKLSEVHQPDGTTSSFGFSVDPDSGHTMVAYDDPASDGTHRRKTVALTSVLTGIPTGANGLTVVNQASMLIRYLTNGDGELAYMNLTPPAGVDNPNTMIVYEAGNVARKVHAGWEEKHFADGWSFGDPANGYLAFQGGFETTYPKVVNTDHDQLRRGSIPRMQDAQGRSYTYEYDAEYFPTKKTYLGDGTFETWQYNAFKQLTRYRDRLGRVTRSTYDAQGNCLQRESGILEVVGGVDQNQPEYAVMQWEFHPAGDPAQFLLKAEIDANGNRTEYVYNAQRLLQEIREPNDDGVGNHVAHTFAYDAAARLVASTDAVGRTVSYEYDARDRVVKTTYMDNSTEETTYGAPGSGDENLVVSKKDRNGNLTTFAYDSTGRLTLKVVGANDPAIASSTSQVYLSGSSLMASTTVDGDATTYGYDYRNRLVTRTVQPRVGKTLTTTNVYVNNELARTIDPYGRKSYNVYRASDGALMRTVQGAVPADGVTNPATIPRNLGPNAKYAVRDAILDVEGQLVKVIDPRGIEQVTVYDSRGRAVEQTEAFGTADWAKTVTVYDAVGNTVEVQHPRHFDPADPVFGACRTTMAYTARNLLKSRTDGAGTPIAATEAYSYNLDRTIHVRKDARGFDWATLWSSCCANRQTGTIDPIGAGASFEYDAAGNVVFTQTLHGTTTFNQHTTRFDARHRPTATTSWLVDAPTVDPQNPPIAGDAGVPATDGLTTRYAYDDVLDDGVGLDAQFGPHLVGLELGADSDGAATLTTNAAGERSLSVVDGAGRVLRVVQLDGGGAALTSTTITHDAIAALAGFGDVVETLSDGRLGRIARSQSDGLGRTLRRIDALGKISTAAYDAKGNLVSVRDPNGVGADVVYDSRDRAVSTTDRVGSTFAAGFDRHGNRTRSVDAKGRPSSNAFDARDRMVLSTDRLGNGASRLYDVNGNVKSLTDYDGRTTQYEYDERNLRIRSEFPDHVPGTVAGDADYGVVELGYDSAGRRTRRVDPKGDVCLLSYDRADRMLVREFRTRADDALGQATDADSFTYDGVGRMLTAQSGRYANLVTLSYDAAGRTVEESLQIGGRTYSVGAAYDDAGRRNRMAFPDDVGGAASVAMQFSVRDETTEISYHGAAVDLRTFDDGGRSVTRTLGNGRVESRTYRPDNLLASVATPGVGAMNYDYDQNKNRTGESLADALSPFGFTAQYDAEDRMIDWRRADAQRALSWNLSAQGDWNSRTEDGVAIAHAHSAFHELVAVGGAPYSYDPNGNLVTRTGPRPATFTWDLDNRLQASTGPEGNASYAYDALGRRVRAGDRVVVWDGLREAAEYSLGDPPSAPKRKFIYGDYLDEVLLVDDAAHGRLYVHPNALHSVAALSGPGGAVIERNVYDPYGRHFTFSGVPPAAPVYSAANGSAVGNDVYFTGRRLDPTGLYHIRARQFDPEIGRFLGRDPVGFGGGLNMYSYADGGPASFTDPLGLWKVHPKDSSIYIAEKDGERLQDLAKELTGEESDWPCIWLKDSEKGEAEMWKDYPTAKCKARADVSNLQGKRAKSFRMYGWTDEEDKYLRNMQKLMSLDGTKDMKSWRSTPGAIDLLKEASGEGNTPLEYLVIGGHAHETLMAAELAPGARDAKGKFTFEDVMKGFSNADNTPERSRARKGPPKCWFTNKAKVYFFGCRSNDVAKTWAENVLRKGTIAHGTTLDVWLQPEGKGIRANFSDSWEEDLQKGDRAYSMKKFFELDKYWEQHKGTQ